jgi:hypothetical protein
MIRINGHLGATLLAAFPAMASQQQGPETVLTGVLDRPGLCGVLAEIEALGLDLIEVRQITRDSRSPERRDTGSHDRDAFAEVVDIVHTDRLRKE